MRRKILSVLALAISIALLSFGISWAGEQKFFRDYYSFLEEAASEGDISGLSSFVDLDSNYGREIENWLSTLNKKGISVVFDELEVDDIVKSSDTVQVSVKDVMTMTYPDERIKIFRYKRVYSLKGDSPVIFKEDYAFDEVKQAKKSGFKEANVKTSPTSESFSPLSFLPDISKGDVSALLRWNNPADFIESIAKDYVTSSDLHSIKEDIPPVDEGAVAFSMTDGGLPRIFGAIKSRENVDPSKTIRMVLKGMSKDEDEEFSIKPYDGNLKEELKPLMAIEFPEDDDMPILYTALWKADGRTVLVSLSDSDLNSMVDVVAGKVASIDGSSHFDGDKVFQVKVNVSNKFLAKEVIDELDEDDKVKLYSKSPLLFETALTKVPSELSLQFYSNLVELFLDPSIKDSLAPVGEDLPFFGGKIIGFLAARLEKVNQEDFISILNSQLSVDEKEQFDQALAQIKGMTGLTLDDFLKILGGRVTVTVGSRSRSPIGDVPGIYLQFEPEEKDVLKKVAQALPKIYEMVPPVGLTPLNVDGWDVLYGMNGMASVSVGVNKDRFLIGAVDYEKLTAPAEIPDNLNKVLKENNLSVFAISIKDLRTAVEKVASQNSIFLQDEEVKDGISSFMDVTKNILDLVLRASSREEMSISIRYIENSK